MKGIRLFGEFAKEVPKEYKIAVGIITHPYVILVAQSKYNAIYFPGGTLEPGESPLDCLMRELKEEINLNLVKISKSYITTWVYSPKKQTYVRVDTYAGKVKGEIKIKGDEIESVIIVPFKKLDLEYIRWLSRKYLIGPSVVDCFIFKRKEVEKMINEVET